jgi:para-nitrobenzyl esterase
VTANNGLLDQIAALQWIQKNIENFGGDPKNITVFGESAGGLSTLLLVAIPAAKGLFKRVISQSAPILDPKPTLKTTTKLFQELNLEFGDIDSLRKLSSEKINNASNQVILNSYTDKSKEIMLFRPSIDGKVLTMTPLEAIRKGFGKNIDIMIGNNKNEWNYFTARVDDEVNMEMADLLDSVYLSLAELDISLNQCKNIIETYIKNRRGLGSIKAFDIKNAIVTDFIYRIFKIHLLEAQFSHNPNSFNYIFSWPSKALDGLVGCPHAFEIPYVFGNLDKVVPGPDGFTHYIDIGKEDIAVSNMMMDIWAHYARYGNPTTRDISEWSSYNPQDRSVMVLNRKCKVVHKPFEEERIVWGKLLEF